MPRSANPLPVSSFRVRTSRRPSPDSPIALTSTIFNLAIQLSDVDRGVYETIVLKVAQHPSETEEYLVTRVLAYCLEYTEGISFSRGLSDPDEPTIAIRDLTGALKAWIEIGTPSAARLHKASKASPRLAVYTHKAPHVFLRPLAGERIHRADAVELYAIDRELIDGLVARLQRRMAFDLSVTDHHLFVTIDGTSIDGAVQRLSLSDA